MFTDFNSLKEAVDKMSDSRNAVAAVTEYLAAHPADDEALCLRGMKYWSLNERSNAINDYLAAVEINPEGKGKMLLKTTYEILDFYNKDLYNP